MGVLVRELVAKLVSLIPLRLNFATRLSGHPQLTDQREHQERQAPMTLWRWLRSTG
jgi:hypothetical protein